MRGFAVKPAVIIACLLVAAFRPVLLFVDFNSHVEVGYQAVAHMLVGGLLAVGYTLRWLGKRTLSSNEANAIIDDISNWTMTAGWSLTAVEVICAGITIARKFA
jgi:hypothetical protein